MFTVTIFKPNSSTEEHQRYCFIQEKVIQYQFLADGKYIYKKENEDAYMKANNIY